MKYELQLLNTKKFSRIMLLGLILTLICFLVTFLNIKHFGFLTWLFSWMVIVPFFVIGLKLSKFKTSISINGENYRFGDKEFNLNEVSSYEYTGTGYANRLNIRLKNDEKISIVCRKSSTSKETFIDFAKDIINNIEIYNSKNQNDKIAQYDVFHAKYSKLAGLLLILIDILLTYFILTSGNDQKYFGVVMINILLILVMIPIFRRKINKKYFG